MIGGWVLDAEVLRRFATGSSVYAQALVWTAVEESLVLLVPAAAVARSVTNLDERDYPVLTVLLDLPVTVIDDLTRQRAWRLGQLLDADTADDLALGHAVDCARDRGWPLLTGNVNAANHLDHTIDARELP